MEDNVVWREEPNRDAWWRQVLGLVDSARECEVADVIDQAQSVPFDEDQYPPTSREPVAA